MIDHDSINSLPDSDAEAYISHQLLSHVLTEEDEQMS